MKVSSPPGVADASKVKVTYKADDDTFQPSQSWKPDKKVVEATQSSFSLKQRLSIAEAFEPNAFGKVPKVCIWDGAVRSGKTIASLMAWVMFVANAPRGGELVVVGRTRESIARNVFGPLTDPDIFGDFSQFISYTAGAPTAKMFGRTIHVLGASDARSEMVLRGLTLVGGYVDEATLVAEPFWVQLLARLSVLGAQLFATTNPDGPAHYLNKTVIRKIEVLGYKRFRFRLQDNEFLMKTNPDYVEQLMLEYSGLWKLRFIEGLWVQADGAVYDNWDEKRHVVQPGQVPQIERVYGIGLDFGTIHPTRAYIIGLGKHHETQEDCLYTLAEFAPPTGKTTGVQSVLFSKWKDEVEAKWGRADWVAIDGAAAHMKAQLFEDGMSNVMNAHKSVEAGIMTISSLLGVGRLLVSSDCSELVDEIPGYMWDAKATARGETKPVKEHDDAVDAWRYAIYTFRRFWRDRIPVTPARDDAPGFQSDELDDAA